VFGLADVLHLGVFDEQNDFVCLQIESICHLDPAFFVQADAQNLVVVAFSLCHQVQLAFVTNNHVLCNHFGWAEKCLEVAGVAHVDRHNILRRLYHQVDLLALLTFIVRVIAVKE